MMNKLFFVFQIMISISCSREMVCVKGYESLKQGSCNMIVEENVSKNSSREYQLNLRGREVDSKDKTVFKPNPRGWEGFSKYINIGDTVVKKQGIPILYIYKKDSILTVSFDNFCEEDFDFDKVLSVRFRNNLNS